MRAAFARRYDRIIATMEQHWLHDARAALLADVGGHVVEIGSGTGKNLAHYGAGVEKLTLTEPTPTMRDLLRGRLATAGLDVPTELVDATADRLPLPDDSADVIVSTLVLCSVPALGPAVAELRRVLRPDGRLVLIEHVAATSGRERRWQTRVNPAWNWLEGSCNLHHDTDTALAAGGFDTSGLSRSIRPGQPPLLREFVVGTATLR